MNISKLFETIINESIQGKISYIKRLQVDDDKKEEYIDFFSSHPNLESEIDWNNFDERDIEEVISNNKYSRSNKKAKQKNLSALIHNEDILLLKDTDDGSYYGLLSHDAAVFVNSEYCDGQPAKWCIGKTSDSSWWDDRVSRGTIFIYYYDRNNEYKFMIELEPYQGDIFDNDEEKDSNDIGSITIWNAGNHIELESTWHNFNDNDVWLEEAADFCELTSEELESFYDRMIDEHINYEDPE